MDGVADMKEVWKDFKTSCSRCLSLRVCVDFVLRGWCSMECRRRRQLFEQFVLEGWYCICLMKALGKRIPGTRAEFIGK
jgi:hypothetical protein